MTYSTNPSVDELPSYHISQPTSSPPPYTLEKRTLKPSSALQNARYGREFVVGAHSFTIAPGPNNFSAPQGLWKPHVHPEGMPYYCNEQLRVVTDNDIHDGKTMERLSLFMCDIVEALDKCNLLLEESWDICLQLDDTMDTCYYYIADHSRRTLFWLEEVESEDVGLPYAATPAQLRWALEEGYWGHVEFFPLRTFDIKGAASELTRILMFGRGDQLTSSGSTFPYDANQCKDFLRLIRDSPHEGQEFTWLIARLWTFISRHRFTTYYGEPHARLDRDQRRLGPRVAQRPWWMRGLSAALLSAPEQLATEMDLLYVDELLYTNEWRKFIKSRMSDWRQSSVYAAATLIAHLLATQVTTDPMSRAVGLAGSVLSTGSLIATTGLLQRYSGAPTFHATDVVEHVRALDHPKLGFQLVASVFSLPKALQGWSLLILPAQIIFAAIAMEDSYSLAVLISLGFVIACILFATTVSLAADHRQGNGSNSWWGRLLPGCHYLDNLTPDASPV